jgi:predicted nucleic acid-binding protein
MESLGRRLREGTWGLSRARSIAEKIAEDKIQVRALIRELFDEEAETRKRAADVARRITEIDGSLLERYADELAGLLETLPVEESRTRWHLGLVVPRVAHTRPQRLRAARTMSLLAEGDSNVVMCSAVEGLGLLALQEASLRDEAEENGGALFAGGYRGDEEPRAHGAEDVAELSGRLIADRKKDAHTLDPTDALIAATARVHGLLVATLNRKHFEKLGVELVEF